MNSMLDRLRAEGFSAPAAGHDANIPQFRRGKTCLSISWVVTLEWSAFIALLVGPMILVSGVWQAPAGAAATVGALLTAHRSHIVRRSRRAG
ncbi:hypothetical protein [Streptomyces sp. NPDC127033]|uniref:hypothetical protein n=1 Tax=Streptomyces sp. NPDC127033 TaxID=3347110 RepID=UPI0036478AC9